MSQGVPFDAQLGDNGVTLVGCTLFSVQMQYLLQRTSRILTWPLAGLALGISLPMLATTGALAGEWCADEVEVRARLEIAIENFRQIRVFEQCDYTAVPALVATLNDEDLAVRSIAAAALANMGAAAKDAIPALIATLNDNHSFVRLTAARALGIIVMGLYDAADTSDKLETTQTVALTVQQALHNTDFEIPKQQVDTILRDIAARLMKSQK